MHREEETDQIRSFHRQLCQRTLRDVRQCHFVALGTQPGGRGGQAKWLTAKLIGGDQQNPHSLHYAGFARLISNGHFPLMLASTTIADEILELKKERKAILLAHHYQEPEIQELADVIGDSLELARKAREFEGDVIAFCGVWFMAETAKVLNPSRIVVVPDKDAGCSLVDCCPVEPVREFRRQHP